MALSQSVKESLEEAEASLRNALSFAARQERPMICSSISDLISKIEMMKKMDSLFDTMENANRPGDNNGFFRVFF